MRIPGSIVLVLAALIAAAPALAEEDKPRPKPKPATKKVGGTRKWAFTRLDRAHKALAEDDYESALAALNEMKRNDGKLNASERANMYQTFGYTYAAQGRYDQAAAAFEESLEDEGMPDASRKNIRYNLAQLYVMLKRYDDAIRLFTQWLAEEPNPPAEAHYMVATAYLQKGRADKALPHARSAVKKQENPPEGWLQLLLALLVDRKLYAEAVPVLEGLIARSPKKQYWTQLSAVYGELDKHLKSLGAMEAAHAQGMLTSERELTTLAQLYLYNGVPYKAGRLLEDSLAGGTMPENAKSLELLANSWLEARERERALGPLKKAAARAPTGQLYLRVAQLHVDRARWEEARSALASALKKGGLKRPGTAHLLLGTTNVSLERWDEAKRSFEAARKYDSTASYADQWLASVDSELEVRRQEASLAEDADDSERETAAADPDQPAAEAHVPAD